MEPSVPTGLVLDGTTGVLSGTLMLGDDVMDAVSSVQRAVVVENSAGSARCVLVITMRKQQVGEVFAKISSLEKSI